MTEYSEHLTLEGSRKSRVGRFNALFLVLTPIVAILFQVYVPHHVSYLKFLELPLLVVIYFALMRRQPIPALLFGSAVGLVQDSLSDQPIGLFGIVKTLVGYFGASVSLRFDVENHLVRMILVFFFFVFHQFFAWVLTRALLGVAALFRPDETAIFGLLNAAVAMPLFLLLDTLKE